MLLFTLVRVLRIQLDVPGILGDTARSIELRICRFSNLSNVVLTPAPAESVGLLLD